MPERIGTVIIGGGQAGLSVSHELAQAGVEHVVLERSRVGETWRGRWDSFCLVTPNWSVQLPGHPYDGPDPHGFMLRDELVGYLEAYASTIGTPVREGVEVSSVRPQPDGDFALATSAGDIVASTVVLCTGAYQRPHRPAGAATLPADLMQLDVADYGNPGQLPEGGVLVVGSGQSGCQIAEELHRAGRDVLLACGRAGWSPRRLGGRDVFWWLHAAGDLDDGLDELPSPAARLAANVQASGRDGGHDLHFRTLQRMGVILLGHFLGAEGRQGRFAPDLSESVSFGDGRNAKLMDGFQKAAARLGLPELEIPDPGPIELDSPELVDLSGLGAVVFAGGFRPDYSSWVHCPGAFDELGFPVHEEGASTVIAGLYFVGVHYLRKRKSSLLLGVGEDAAIVAARIGERVRA
jgi:putative flavoprotein involved in K+ transport